MSGRSMPTIGVWMEGKPKIYHSFYDIESSRAQEGYSRTGLGHGLHFGMCEILNILVAIILLAVSFSIVLSSSTRVPLRDFNLNYFLNMMPISLLIVVTGFMFHELAHKLTGMHYGFRSEFRINIFGLLMTFFLAFSTGIVFAAPGAVVIYGKTDRRISGIIAAAGPLANMVVSGIAMLIMNPSGGTVLFYLAFINAFLAAFNLIPIPPFDGSKVVRWNVGIYLIMLLFSVFMVYYLWIHY